jgi:hypothetical protein
MVGVAVILILAGLLFIGLNSLNIQQAKGDLVTGSELLKIEQEATLLQMQRAIAALSCVHGLGEIYFSLEHMDPYEHPFFEAGGKLYRVQNAGLDCLLALGGKGVQGRANAEIVACVENWLATFYNGYELFGGHVEAGRYGLEPVWKVTSLPLTIAGCATGAIHG